MKKRQNYPAFCTIAAAAGLGSIFLLRQNIAAFRYGEFVAILITGFRSGDRIKDWLAIPCAIRLLVVAVSLEVIAIFNVFNKAKSVKISGKID